MRRDKLRDRVVGWTDTAALLVAVAVLLAVLITILRLYSDIFLYDASLFCDVVAVTYKEVFAAAIYTVIGIETAKMIVRRTPKSILDVILFVVAKRIVTELSFGSLDLLLCVLAVAVILAMRRFFASEAEEKP